MDKTISAQPANESTGSLLETNTEREIGRQNSISRGLEINPDGLLNLTEWRLNGIEELRQELPGYTPTTTGANYDPTNTENFHNQSFFSSSSTREERSQGYIFKSDTDFIMSRCAGKQEVGSLSRNQK